MSYRRIPWNTIPVSPSLRGLGSIRSEICDIHGSFYWCVKLRIAHAPGMPGTFSLPPRVSDPDMHHGTCVTHVPWYAPGSLTSGFHWCRWRGKRSWHSRRMRNTQFYVSDKRPMPVKLQNDIKFWHTHSWLTDFRFTAHLIENVKPFLLCWLRSRVNCRCQWEKTSHM